MGNIQPENFFDITHGIVEWQDEYGNWNYPLSGFTDSSLKLYISLSHFANRFNSNVFHMGDLRLTYVTGLSVRQLCRARTKLRELGLIGTYKKVGNELNYVITIMPYLVDTMKRA